MLLDLLVQLDRLDQNWCYRNIQSGATAACLLNASGSLGPIEFEGNSRGGDGLYAFTFHSAAPTGLCNINCYWW